MIWLAFIALAAIAVVLLLRPFLSPVSVGDTRSSELAVYHDQLRELETDLTNGLISPAEAYNARNEIKRRILFVAPTPEASHKPQHAPRALGVVVAAAVPVFAVALYSILGEPTPVGNDNPNSFAMQTEDQPQTAQLPDIETLAARLAERLKKTPDDAEGWRMLGLSYASLDRPSDAAKAYERAVALDGKNASLLAQYGEALVGAANGVVTPPAEQIFARALAIDSNEPRALFFRGLALEQRNKPKQALAIWVKMLRDGDVDAAWIPAVRQRAVDLALKLKLDPSKEVPGASVAPSEETTTGRAPTPDDVAAAAQLSPADRNAMIAGMVQRLEERLRRNANDLEGWLMLARSRKVMGDVNAARTAIERASGLFDDNSQARARIKEVAVELGLN